MSGHSGVSECLLEDLLWRALDSQQALEVLGADFFFALDADDFAVLDALPNCDSIPSASPLLGGSLM